MAFLELKNVSKGYGSGAKRAEVLQDINLNIVEGEFVAIVGYSGAGKTTLVSFMAGLIHPDDGPRRVARRGGAGAGSRPRAHLPELLAASLADRVMKISRWQWTRCFRHGAPANDASTSRNTSAMVNLTPARG